MSHPLRARELERFEILGKPRAMVKVQVVGSRSDSFLELVPELPFVAKACTQLVALPSRVKVKEPAGTIVAPSKGAGFWITVETFDPYHGVVELPDDWRFR